MEGQSEEVKLEEWKEDSHVKSWRKKAQGRGDKGPCAKAWGVAGTSIELVWEVESRAFRAPEACGRPCGPWSCPGWGS